MKKLTLFAGLALLAGLAACGGNEEAASPLPDAGCQGEACSPPDASVDPLPDAGQPDAGEQIEPDAGTPEDAGLVEDAGQPGDGGTSADAGAQEPAGAIAGYLACDDDSECPIGYGNCISAIPLNRRDSTGTLAIRVRDLDPSLTKAGVCSLVCTSNPGICASLTIENLQGQRIPYTCQVLVSGAPTYPSPRPAFPFAEQLSALELQAGRAFGALCRPPLGLSARFDDAFCAPCSGASDCGEGACWSFARWDEVLAGGAGECLVRCADHPDCPFGFSCESLVSDRDGVPFEHGTFCLPFEQTCGACRDLDGDGRGLGRCGSGGAVLGADCDDHDPRAYYDGAQMNHPFPEHCGAHDLNCNGLSDDAEQIGPAGFPAEHCTGCGQPCAGGLPNASSACVFDHASLPSCAAECSDPSAWADCDGLLENGCEQEAGDPARLYYLDADSDGYGAGKPVFACQAGMAPEGYVNRAGDCDDAAASINPGVAADLCNGLDDDCDGRPDEDQQTGAACDTGREGICAEGLQRCQGSAGLQCEQLATATTETCNGLDDDCDGQVDDAIQGAGIACLVDGQVGACAAGQIACDSQRQELYCAQTAFPAATDLPDDGIDADCDGFDGALATSIFLHAGAAEGGDGTRERPVRTVARVVELLAANPGKTAVYVSGAQYQLHRTLELIDGVSFYGSRMAANNWPRGEVRTSFVRTLDNPTDADHLVGIDGLDLVQPTTWKSIDLSFPGEPAPRHVVGLRCSGCTGLMLVDARISSGTGGAGAAAGVTPPAGPDGSFGSKGSGVSGGSGSVPWWGNGGAGGNGGKGGPIFSDRDRGQDGESSCGLGGRGGARNLQPGDLYGQGGQTGANCVTGGTGGAGGSLRLSTDGSRIMLADNGGAAGGSGGGGGGGGGQGGGQNGGKGGDSGGGGGPGGPGGGGGGSSIGLLLFRSTGIAFDRVTVTAGTGGLGGAGADGGKGGNGTHSESTFVGRGGAGSGGGGGGGGAGGSSYGVLRDATTALGASGLDLGTGQPGQCGQGGQGGQGGDYWPGNGGADGAPGTKGSDGEALPDKVL